MTLNAELLDVLRKTCSSLGTSFVDQGANRVLVQPSNRLLFAKLGPVAQVMGEAESLAAMHRASTSAGHGAQQTLIPTVHAFGITQDQRKAYLVTDYLQLSSSLSRTSQRTLGKKLAEMHLHGTSENGMYGFDRATHCGETEQDNTWTESWPEFWAERRIGDLVRRSRDRELLALEQALRKKVYPLLFNSEAMKDVKPAIIHGDLWSGNSGTDDASGQPIIFDPSSSYSHNEAELGIMKMFGGYGPEFFDAYHQVIPKAQPYYEQRIDMYEAYHHLNHFVIFGGGYRSGTVQLFKKLIAWADKENPSKDGSDGGEDNDGNDGNGGAGPSGSRGLRGGGTFSTQGNTYSMLDTNPTKYPPRPPPEGDSGAPLVVKAEPNEDDQFHTHTKHTEHEHRPDTLSSTSMPTATQIADFFSQMVCYIWFSSGLPINSTSPCTPSRSPVLAHQPQQSSPLTPRRHAPNNAMAVHKLKPTTGMRIHHSKTASTGSQPLNAQDLSKAMQNHLISSSVNSSVGTNFKTVANDPVMQRLQPKGRFLRFVRELLSTTQLSTSVITLALVYVYRLKALHPHLVAREGSEYRVGISALMLANKILDDNTYLNKTWAEVSGMPLVEISKMEVEFWLGLKMELHVSKEDYNSGLGELQTMANERMRAIHEREAILKRIAQQQQQPALLTRPSPSIVPLQQAPVRPSGLYAHHQWSASSDCLVPSQPFVNPWQARHEPRHSIAAADGAVAPHYYSHARPSTRPVSPESYEHHHPHFATASISPAHALPYTLASSPLSQGSGVPSLATASNEALMSMSDAEVSTPQDAGAFAGAHGLDNVWSAFGASASGHRDFSMPGTSPGNAMANATGTTTTCPAQEFYRTLPHTSSAPPPPPSSLAHTHHSSNVTGLKRDFERANLGSASPHDGQMYKRFAFEQSDYASNDGRRHYRVASSGHQSPSASAAMRHRPGSGSSQYSNNVRDAMRVSVSPSYAMPPFAAHAVSPAYMAPLPRAQSSWPEDQMTKSGRPVAHMATVQPNSYHSVFSSALTPNALAAPLEVAQNAWPSQRGKVPLQYYSLASGEAHGTLGTYVPPTVHNITHPYVGQTRAWQQPTQNASQEVHSAFATPATRSTAVQTSYGHRNSTSFLDHPASEQVHSHSDMDLSAGKLSHLHVQPNAAESTDQHTRSTYVEPARALPAHPTQQMHHQSQPFYLDPHGWPLSMSAGTTSFVFPWHLIPQAARQ